MHGDDDLNVTDFMNIRMQLQLILCFKIIVSHR